MSDSLWLQDQQLTRHPCSSLSPGVCLNSCPLSRWCHPAILSSVSPFSYCPQSFPESGSFPTSWLFTSGVQSIGASVSASVLPMNVQGWFPLRLTGLIFLQSKGHSKSLLQHHNLKHQFSGTKTSLWSNFHIHTNLNNSMQKKNSNNNWSYLTPHTKIN